MIFLHIILILIGCAILIKSTDWIIKSFVYFAGYFKLPEFVIAFILAGIATSLPELSVGISSGLSKIPILSFSNVIGSNIADISLALGLTVLLLKGLNVNKKIIHTNILYTLILLIYPLLLLLDGTISRLDGVALVILFLLYVIILFHQSQNYTKITERVSRKKLIKNILLFTISTFLLISSAEIIVKSAQKLAIELNIQIFIIGVFLIAFGTSLPEIIFNLRANKKHSDMIFGNILGSIAVNSSLVIGTTAIISPIIINNVDSLWISISFLIISFACFIIFVKTKKRISQKEGAILLFLYISFLITEIIIK